MGSRKFITNIFIVSFALVSIAIFSSCGGSSSSSSKGNDSSPLLSVQTLQKWIASGYKDDDGRKVVILDWSFGTGYANGHISGAVNMGSTASMNRSNGVGTFGGMVWDGATMDAFIQANGIDKNTTLVFTSSSRMMASTRNWWSFSYWGFDAERLKVLNGLASKIWPAKDLVTGSAPGGGSMRAGLTTALTVSSNTLNPNIYGTLDNIIAFADGKTSNTAVIDVRSAGEYNGTPTWSKFPNAIAGHVKGAVWIPWQNFVSDDGKEVYKSSAEIKAVLAAGGVSTSNVVYTHCETAVRSGVSEFAMLGLLGMDAKNYDGAWREWGNMASAANMGTLPDDSPWRTDNGRTASMGVNPNAPAKDRFVLDNAYAAKADAIVLQDMAYGR